LAHHGREIPQDRFDRRVALIRMTTRSAIGQYFAAIAVVALLGLVGAQAQDFPTRPVRLIVPYAPGGGADIVGRLVAAKLTEAWGQPVVVENKAGANGVVASEYVLQQPADGTTMMVGTIGSHAVAQYLNPKLGYDPLTAFAGVIVLAYSPLICLVAPSAPYRTLRELVDDAKTKPMSFGSPGIGSQMHLIGETFNLSYGTQFQHVAYRGVAPAMQDLLGGHIPMVMGEMGSSKPLVVSGQLRALAVTGTARNPSVPDVPTFTEAGYPGFEVSSWFALFVAAGTPRPIVEKIAADTTRIVHSPEISARLTADGWEPGGGTPEEFTAFWRETAKQLGHVIQERHITVE
jgi:tripartite-type tricarboxylate transporter receptor subunit TctC